MASPDRAQEQQFPCNITFDQLGNVGKLLSTMKLDEFLKNVISVEEAQLLQNVNPSSSSSSSSSSSARPFFLGDFDLNNGMLSKKPVDDAWKDIDNQEHVNVLANQSIQQRLGETSLEDFLVRAGVVNIGNQNAMLDPHQPIMDINSMVVVSQQEDWLQLQRTAVQQEQQQQQHQMTVLDSDFYVSESGYENPVVDVGYADNQLAITMPMPAISATSSESQAVAEKKRRYSDEVMEKTIERRQKRMIKNRESAARSRARKQLACPQAYTNQLEHEVFQLQKTNSWLKKLKEQERLLSSNPVAPPRYQLRRTSSASF
ncbi:ABSCISIC ACID-INSENSITIVE 5-like protein 3 isoform X2 [Ricinus communis]|uniref:ABSCISIC ACID-INSENSITIVE 5-like protein 3 isoform X2 n=1 Tax=Ricinus communis TaxID=3988 RepID=UPI00201AD7D8|nr:ABSCISIC ACID-INSENSITIVE 5-like protein 3 isoform X2 [Ricinus communis]